MTKNRTFTSIRVIFLALAATVASVGLLSAEDYKGTFTLPFETKWGRATLPPGDYTFKLNMNVSPFTAKVSGNDVQAYILATGIDDRNVAGQSALIIVRHGRKGTVRALRLADRGLVFTYPLPKSERRMLMLAQKPELFQRLQIVASAK